jgi:peptide/nickel transport system permease protein
LGKLILSRFTAAVPLLFALSILTFLLVHLIPGSAAVIMLGDSATPENVAALEAELGFDDPLPQQYARWLAGVSRGDFGKSLFSGRPVWGTISERLPPTISIACGALFFSIIFGILAGILAAIRPGSLLDRMITVGGTVGISLPYFWVAVLFSIFFAVKLGWFPAIGYVPINESALQWARCLVLPSVALGITSSAVIARQMRGSLIEVMQTDYIRAARATGIPERVVVYKHGLKNAMIPVMTIIGFQIPVILGGAFVVEIVFAIPGLGSLTVTSVLDQDIPVVQSVVLLTGFFIVITNLLVDISYSWLNPKVRIS